MNISSEEGTIINLFNPFLLIHTENPESFEAGDRSSQQELLTSTCQEQSKGSTNKLYYIARDLWSDSKLSWN